MERIVLQFKVASCVVELMAQLFALERIHSINCMYHVDCADLIDFMRLVILVGWPGPGSSADDEVV